MEGIRFYRPVGPCSDTNEVEYISALLQTGPTLRENGTITAEDIVTYLRSRHGMNVSEDTVKDSIMRGLCCCEGDGCCMDICDLVCLLMIPYLMYLKRQTRKGSIIFDQFFDLLVREVECLDPTAISSTKKNQIELTPTLLHKIVEHYSEKEIPSQIVQSMIRSLSKTTNHHHSAPTTTTTTIILDKETYLQALTKDIHYYNLEWEERKSLFFEDAKEFPIDEEENETETLFGGRRRGGGNARFVKREEKMEYYYTQRSFSKLRIDDEDNTELPFERIPVGSNLDSVGDTFHNRRWNILLWFFVVLTYSCYGFGVSRQKLSCIPDTFTCDAAHAIISWMWTFVQICVFGFGTLWVASLGNYDYSPTKLQSKWKFTIQNLLSIVVTSMVVIGPFVENDMNNVLFNTNKRDIKGFQALYYICFTMGITIIAIQLIRIVQIWVPIMIPYFTDDALRSERSSKLASRAKIKNMVENALAMHYQPEYVMDPDEQSSNLKIAVSELYRHGIANSNSNNNNNHTTTTTTTTTHNNNSSVAQTILNYDAMQGVAEETGGILWTWSRMMDGSLFHYYGIRCHARLIAINISQLSIIIFLSVTFVTLTRLIHVPYDRLWIADQTKDDVDFLGEWYAENAIDLSFLEASDIDFFNFIGDIRSGAITDHIEDAIAPFVNNNSHSRNRGRRHDGRYMLLSDSNNSSTTTTFVASDFDKKKNRSSYILYVNIITFLSLSDATNSTPKGNNKTTSTTTTTNPSSLFDLYVQSGDYNTAFFDPKTFNTFINGSLGSLFISSSGIETTNGVFFYNETSGGDFFYDWDYVQWDNFLPNLWELETALIIGSLHGLIAVMGLIIILLPSYVSTVLKFRSGFIGSLRNHHQFAPLRQSLDATTQIFGCAFWGAFIGGFFTMMLVSVIVFILLYHKTRKYVLIIIAHVLGIIVMSLLIALVLKVLVRPYCTLAFYRKQPWKMNIVNTILECWYIALMMGYVISRTLILLVVAIFYIGRIDTPVLAPGVGYFGSIALDHLPMTFKKDILQHEAHRHPYIERLGLLFMMRLRHGEAFGSSAGSYWRLLFVMSLMPWMRKYRRHKLDESYDVQDSYPPVPSREEFRVQYQELHELRHQNDVLKHNSKLWSEELEKLRRQNEVLLEGNSKLWMKLEMLREGRREEREEEEEVEEE